ncbi:MAG: hypothetical protein ACHREM_13815 [Polyangiales bacterium]
MREGGGPVHEGGPALESGATPAGGKEALLRSCDEYVFGPCGEGGDIRQECQHGVNGLDAAPAATFVACVKKGIAAVAPAPGDCAKAARACGEAHVKQYAAERAQAVCIGRLYDECRATAEYKTAKTCFDACRKPAHSKDADCRKSCGEPDKLLRDCARKSEGECKSLVDAYDTATKASTGACTIAPACQAPVAKVCTADVAVIRICQYADVKH